MAAGPDRDAIVQRGKQLEGQKRYEEALALYADEGMLDHVGRVEALLGRYADAARSMLRFLGTTPAQVSRLNADGKRKAMMAALWFAKGGETKSSVDLLLRLGQRQRAIQLLETLGDTVGAARLREEAAGLSAPSAGVQASKREATASRVSAEEAARLESAGQFDLAMKAYAGLRQLQDAARMAVRLERFVEAGQLYSDAGLFYEAAGAFIKGGDNQRSLEHLMLVDPEDSRYRLACTYAIRLATQLDSLEFQLDFFLKQFVQSGPIRGGEGETFLRLSDLYLRHDKPENAMEILRKVEEIAPGMEGLAPRMLQAEQALRGDDKAFEEVLRQEEAFRGSRQRRSASDLASMPRAEDLPELPDLPEPPPMPVATAFTPMPISSSVSDLANVGGQGTATPMPAHLTAGTAATMATPMPSVPGVAPPLVTNPLDHFVEGGVIADRYRIIKKIGQGGMAMVFKVEDTDLGEIAALKLFLTVGDDTMIERFKQELKLSRKLNHPNVIRLYDIGTHMGYRYISMELLSGCDLKGKMAESMSVAQGIEYLVQSTLGLKAAHDAGVIHRDIKPDNLFCCDDGVVKLMDFGIAKGQAAKGLTVTGMVAGTPEYMSPEQINNFSKVGPSTDLYAMGIIAYEMFTGRVPFWHGELMQLLMMHVTKRPDPPRERNPHLPEDIEAVVLKLLEKEPSDRYRSCDELLDALCALQDRYGRPDPP